MQAHIPRTLAYALALLAFLATASIADAGISSTITYPEDGETVSGADIVITGTVTTEAGTEVSCVEVSTDGGNTWGSAVGTTAWHYSWAPSADGSYNIRTRITDGNGTIDTSGPGITFSVNNAAQ